MGARSHVLQDESVRNALLVGLIVSALSGALGYFAVLRRLAFVGHAVTDFGFSGGAGAVLIGVSAIWGFLLFSILGALGVDRLSLHARERDVATGMVLSLALGVGALFLYFSTRFVSEPATLLFGSIFEVDPAVIALILWIAFACFAGLAVLYRPLTFATFVPDVAAARGVPVRLLGTAYMILMAIGVAESAQVVGILLSTALLIGPAAAATYLARRPLLVLSLAMAIAVGETILGIVLAYVSYTWPPGGKGWPVSFFVTILALAAYLAARGWHPATRRPPVAAIS